MALSPALNPRSSATRAGAGCSPAERRAAHVTPDVGCRAVQSGHRPATDSAHSCPSSRVQEHVCSHSIHRSTVNKIRALSSPGKQRCEGAATAALHLGRPTPGTTSASQSRCWRHRPRRCCQRCSVLQHGERMQSRSHEATAAPARRRALSPSPERCRRHATHQKPQPDDASQEHRRPSACGAFVEAGGHVAGGLQHSRCQVQLTNEWRPGAAQLLVTTASRALSPWQVPPHIVRKAQRQAAEGCCGCRCRR